MDWRDERAEWTGGMNENGDVGGPGVETCALRRSISRRADAAAAGCGGGGSRAGGRVRPGGCVVARRAGMCGRKHTVGSGATVRQYQRPHTQFRAHPISTGATVQTVSSRSNRINSCKQFKRLRYRPIPRFRFVLPLDSGSYSAVHVWTSRLTLELRGSRSVLDESCREGYPCQHAHEENRRENGEPP